jgi:hypothetical protein
VDVLVPNIWFHRYKEVDGKMVDIEGRCKLTLNPLNSNTIANTTQSTITPGRNPLKASNLPPPLAKMLC